MWPEFRFGFGIRGGDFRVGISDLTESKLQYNSQDLVKKTHKLQKENEELIEKQRKTEDHMKDINEQISKYQYEYKMLPEQYDNLNNHFLITQQEER